MNIFAPALEKKIAASGNIAVVVIDDAAKALPLAEALLAGGVDVMELTLRTPVALDAIRAIAGRVKGMLVGAGTVLTPTQLKQVSDAGAAFAVAPGFNPRVVAAAKEMGFSFAPGVMTPSEIEGALEAGCRLLKYFPAGVVGRLRAMRDAGGAVLLVSSELDEILALADRVLVMAGGVVTGELPIAQCSEAALGRLMAGIA